MQGTWALTNRALRQDSRLLRYHLLRFAVGFLLALFVFFMWQEGSRGDAPGRNMLEAMAYGNFAAITIVGCLLFAPTITEEKEDQTLGLLQMTRIGPSSLLLGKAIPKLVLIGLVLIVQLPLVFLSLTLGGVTWPLIVNVYLLLGCQLLVIVSFSMVSSVMMRTSLGAVVLSGLLALLWTIFFPEFLSGLQRSSPIGTPQLSLAQLASPLVQLDAILRTGANTRGAAPTCMITLFIVATCYMFGVRTFSFWNPQESTRTEAEFVKEYFFDRLWNRFRRRPDPAASASLIVPPAEEKDSEPNARKVTPSPPRRASRSRPSQSSWQQAIMWKDYFLLGGGRTGLRVRATLALAGTFLCLISLIFTSIGDVWTALWLGTFTYGATTNHEVSYSGGQILALSLWAFSLDLIYLTVNLFAYEIRHQTWESLLILPRSLGSICRQKIAGAAIHLIPWTLSGLVGLSIMTTWEDIGYLFDETVTSPWMTLCVVLHITSQLFAFFMVFTWLSLRLNPWVTILIMWFLYSGLQILFLITTFMAFGFMSGPGPIEFQVLFHVGWTTFASLAGYQLLRSIRKTLLGEAATA